MRVLETMERTRGEKIAEAGRALRAYREARDTGRLTREEAVYLMDTAFFSILALQGREIWGRDYEARASAIQCAHGLADHEKWEPKDQPEEYRRLLGDYRAALDRLENRTASEHGCEEILNLYRHDRAELDRLYDAGKRSLAQTPWELRTRYRPVRDPAEWAPAVLQRLGWRVLERLREQAGRDSAAFRFDSVSVHTEIPALWLLGEDLPDCPEGPSLSDPQAIADHVDQESRLAQEGTALRWAVPPLTRVVENERTRIRVHPEAKRALAKLGRRERKARMREWRTPYEIAFQVTGLAEGAPYSAQVTVHFHPLVLDCDRKVAFHPAQAAIAFSDGIAHCGKWSGSEVSELWRAIEDRLSVRELESAGQGQ